MGRNDTWWGIPYIVYLTYDNLYQPMIQTVQYADATLEVGSRKSFSNIECLTGALMVFSSFFLNTTLSLDVSICVQSCYKGMLLAYILEIVLCHVMFFMYSVGLCCVELC